MDEEGIRATWRAAVVPGNSEQPVYGNLSWIGRRSAVVRMDHNLAAGQRCTLALMLPKHKAGMQPRFIEGSGVISLSVVRSMQFHITIDPLNLSGNGVDLLEEQIRLHGQIWRPPQ
ncbi:MAG TPA: hypothetical protein VFW53_12035 [Gallionella sp.]|nr:hypothetical protein [Gallionella sp.]